jgi:hypothetical protein
MHPNMARPHLGASWANLSLAQSPASAKVAQQSRKPAGKNANNLSRKTTSDTWSPKIVTLHDVPIWDKCEAVQGLGDSKFSMGFTQKLTNKQMTYLLSYATGAAPMDRLLHHTKSTQFQMWTVMCQAKKYPLFHVASLEEALKAGKEQFGEFGDPFTVEQDDHGNTFLCNGQTSAVLPESHYEWHCFQGSCRMVCEQWSAVHVLQVPASCSAGADRTTGASCIECGPDYNATASVR